MGCSSSHTAVVRHDIPVPLEHKKPSRPRKCPLLERYAVGAKIGRGHFASVWLATHKQTRKDYALKVIKKSRLHGNHNSVVEEILAMNTLSGHPFIAQLHETGEDDRAFYLVLELCEGGTLFEALHRKGQLSEKHSVLCTYQIGSALTFMHSMCMVHRDLKPENILLNSRHLRDGVKVVDFGLAKRLGSIADNMKTVCGTWHYCAPEILLGEAYTSSVDVWALGVLLFVMLSGYHPFDPYGDLPDHTVHRNIKLIDYSFDDPAWEGVSAGAMRLIARVLRTQGERISLEEFMRDPWLVEALHRSPISPQVMSPLHSSFGSNMSPLAAELTVATRLQQESFRRGSNSISEFSAAPGSRPRPKRWSGGNNTELFVHTKSSRSSHPRDDSLGGEKTSPVTPVSGSRRGAPHRTGSGLGKTQVLNATLSTSLTVESQTARCDSNCRSVTPADLPLHPSPAVLLSKIRRAAPLSASASNITMSQRGQLRPAPEAPESLSPGINEAAVGDIPQLSPVIRTQSIPELEEEVPSQSRSQFSPNPQSH